MAAVARILSLICITGCHLTSASPVPGSPQEVQEVQQVQALQEVQEVQQVQQVLVGQEVQEVQALQAVQGVQEVQEVQRVQAVQEVQEVQAVQEVQEVQAVQEVQRVQEGQEVRLTCNLTSSAEVSWFFLRRSRQLLPLLTVWPSKIKGVIVSFHLANASRFSPRGEDLESGPQGLDLLEVTKEDAGVYFCTGRHHQEVRVSEGTQLIVGGEDGGPTRRPCWGLEIFLLLVFIVVLLLFIVLLLVMRSGAGKLAVCCWSPDGGQRVTEDEALHYSSLKYMNKPRPPGRKGAGLVKEDVTYSAVVSRRNLNAPQGGR